MTYTRKPKEARTVTFSVSWIEEEVTIFPFGDMPREAMEGIVHYSHEPLLLALPMDIRPLIEDCTADEFSEFIESWSGASRDEMAEQEAMQEQFRGITRMMMDSLKKKSD